MDPFDFDNGEVPADLRARAKEREWPDDLAQRFWSLRFTREQISQSIEHWQVTQAQSFVEFHERVNLGTLRVREATYYDGDAFAALWSGAPEDIGEFEVTVERSPNAFAQFWLQENVSIIVVEDRRLFIACGAQSRHNTYVAGKPISVIHLSGWRVHKDFRGGGYSRIVQQSPGNACSPWAWGQYFTIRSQNFGAVDWMESLRSGFLESAERPDEDVPGMPLVVLQIPARTSDADDTDIRRACREDLDACVSLVNRTHCGLDLFRPYTSERLLGRLENCGWGPKPDWWFKVYGWDDYWVVQDAGRVVACAGLWDRGRHLREVWRPKGGGDATTIACTALLDWGYADGHEDAMARLVEFLAGETARAERTFLLAPLQQHPDLAARIGHLNPLPERRGLIWNVLKPEGGYVTPPDPAVTRPHVDLAYW